MATLAQLNPEAKRYPKQIFDWRKTHIALTQGAAQSEPYGRDAAMDAVDRRKKLHGMLDQACSKGNVTADRAQNLHATLDRVLDENQGQFPGLKDDDEPSEESEEEPEEESESEEPEAAKDSGRMSYAKDAGKCGAECRIQDNHVPARKTIALDAAQNDMAATIVTFWKQFGINLARV